MAAFLMFMLYDVTGGTLLISEVFSAYFILGFLRFYFVYFVSNAFNFVVETRLLFKRLDVIMDYPEMETVTFEAPKDPANAVEFDKYTAYWAMEHLVKDAPDLKKHISATAFDPSKFDTSDLRPVLRDVDLNIKKGSLTALIGAVGNSKTSFLLSFTGEIPKTTGALRYKGKIAYVEQEPTIFAGNFRESILFGNEYNEEFYKKVIKACNLESDLKLFPNGDMFIVGERGNNLSGGQKARLALARAVYANADIYLLDDPLSAVDAKVAKSIFSETILGLLKDKTVILATHQVHFVRELEHIIVIDDGKVAGSGSFEELKQQGVDVNKIFSVEKDEGKTKEEDVGGVTKREERPADVQTEHTAAGQEGQAQHQKEEDHGEGPSNESEVDPHAGKVTLKTYGLLFRQAGLVFMLGLVCLYVLLQFGDVAFGRILGAWTSGEFGLGESLGALGGIAGYMIIIYQIKNMAFTFGFLNASKKYHKKMLNKIIRSPVVFFDINPVGRILNRFSNDIGVLDKFVPHVGLDVFDILFAVGSVIITLSIIDPVLIAPLAGALIMIGILIFFYYPTIKQTKGYDLSTRGPLYSLLSSSISGIVIIRTYGQADHLKERFTKMLYTNTKGNINFILSSRILGFCVDLTYNLTAIGMIFITTGRINPNDTDSSSGAIAAFSLALILSLTGIFQHGVRQFCQTNVLMSAAARVQAYCALPSEAALTCPEDQALIEKKWPNSGEIDFNRVYMKYRPETPFVIQDLNLHADSGEKIGCVGRTGAGKSTIINLLFRLQEIDRSGDHIEGSSIKMDHTDTQPLGLHLLRGNISIIPQSPFIFTGTVRQNVDPLGEYSDEQIWNALEEVRLKDHVSRLVNKLDTNMSNVSAVFSVGQKQLVCLARALLKPKRILVLDEATANMDTETDTFIQEKIMEKFSESTVFTIAHRLATIAHYDKVLVLDKGKKMEFDAPYKLLVKNEGDTSLTNPTGHFGSMVMNTGPKTSQRIVNLSKEAFDKKQKGHEIGPNIIPK